MRVQDRFFIGGEWVEPVGTATIEVTAAATEEPIGRVPDGTDADMDRAVAAAREAFDSGPWPRMAPAERADVMARISQGLQARMQEIGETISSENGSPISWSVMAQVFASTMVIDYYAGLAREYAFEESRVGVMGPVIVRREPIGVAGAIVPWNVPLFTTALKLGPAFAGGCTMVLKPSSETPLDAYMLAEIALEAGLPPGVLNVVSAGRKVGEHLVAHPGVDKIGFTGSTSAGRRIASVCGEHLKKVTLELGGKSAAIVLDDADIATAMPALLPNSMMNNGQACVAQSRILAPRSLYSEVVEALVAAAQAMKVGDPLDPETNIGPLVAERQRSSVERYIAIGRDEGARVAVGGGRPAGFDRGWYVEPTVFADVDNKMRVAQEEIFGPVVVVIPYDGVDDAIAIANDSDYGLAGSVWTTDIPRGIDVARQVRTGTYTLNGLSMDFAAPFGGYKSSGLGRELGPEGLHHYLEDKSIYLPAGFDAAAAVRG